MIFPHLIEQSPYPADDDVPGQIAIALAVMDVTEPPRAMTASELAAFNKLMTHAWNDKKLRQCHDQLREFQAREQGAHIQLFKGGSFPIHYARSYWREYLGYAQLALDVAHRVYGKAAMRGARHAR